MSETFKRYVIERSMLPSGSHKFAFQHKDFDGAPDGGDHRFGYGPTIEDCKRQIEEIEMSRQTAADDYGGVAPGEYIR